MLAQLFLFEEKNNCMLPENTSHFYFRLPPAENLVTSAVLFFIPDVIATKIPGSKQKEVRAL